MRNSFLLRSCLIIQPSSSFLVLRNFSIISSFPPTFFPSVFCILYLTTPIVSLLWTSLGVSFKNFFLLFSSSYCLTSSASSLYSLSNSLTSSFTFFRFSLLSQVSFSGVYPFYCTKNFSFLLTILLFSIFSILNSSSSLIITVFGGVFLCPSTWGLYNYTWLMLTTEYILIELGGSNSIVLVETIPLTL